MVPSGPPTPVGGAQSVPPSLLRTNSGILGAQGGAVSSQSSFPSLLSPRSQFNNMNILGNMSNVSSLLSQSFGNGGSNSGISASGSLQRAGMDMGGAESDPLSGVASSMAAFNPSFSQPNNGNPNPSVQVQGQHFQSPSGTQMGPDQAQPHQLESQSFLHGQQPIQQFPIQQQQQQQQQQPPQQQQQPPYQSLRGGLGGVGPVKLEPQMSSEQNGPLRSLGPVKLEPQQLQSLRSLGTVKMEPHTSDQSLFLQQQQQQQQYLQMSRQSPQAAAAQMNLLQQQRILQLQHQQQQQQMLKALPQQRAPLQQQFQQQNLPVRNPVKTIYEPGMCARRLTHYMYHQQHRPADNNIEFWRKFVAEYFAPHAKKRWCVSLYGTGRQTTGVFPQDVWHCEICNRKPGRGFETTVEVLPRLCKIKYDSGTLEELLYVDMPREYQNASGQIVLDYAKAIQESVFDQLRVVRDGQLRIVFSPDLKICSWEFCARRHEELIPRRLIIPQVSQLGAVAQKYQAATQNANSNLSAQDLQSNCNMFVASARQLAKTLEVPLVNDLGYTKRYVRCLQISEVVNSMKDLIDYSRETGTGPMASLINFPRRTATTSGLLTQGQQPEEQQPLAQNNTTNDQTSVQAAPVQIPPSNGVVSVNNSPLNSAPSTNSTATTTIVGLLHQNAMNNSQETPISNANSPYGGPGPSVQIPSASSSTSLPQSQQPTPASPFPSPTPSTSNNPQQNSHSTLPPSATTNSPANISMQPSQSNDADPNDSQSSVQQIIQEMMMSSQLSGGNNMVGMGTLGNEIKGINGMVQTGTAGLNGGTCLVGNGLANGSGITGVGFGNMSGIGPTATASGIRATMGSNNPVALNGRAAMGSMPPDSSMNHQNQDLGSRLLSGLGSVNSFNNLQFDWKSSP
ncbi:hypothetical protein H6P81_001792 [Aristolochia fimbriata]|uniref:Transcriptional corepressor SEUSS n=1 Tax=Aristolochia fimbriata TaxID=158543 RepID=A0AAV7F9K1_ARIFI|nr:hypothetical protein H6P81_001792 [Aristolochia fimbriata]